MKLPPSLPLAFEPRPAVELIEATDLVAHAKDGRVVLRVVAADGRQLDVIVPPDSAIAAAMRLHFAARTAIATAHPRGKF